MFKLNGYTPAKYLYYNDDIPKFGYIFDNERINGKLSQVFVNENADFIMVKGDNTTVPLLKITNKNGYLCLRVRRNNYLVHAILLYTFKQDELPEDFLENKRLYDGTRDDESYSIEHINQCRYNYNLDNLTILTRRDNRRNRIWGSRNEANVKRIGNDAKYKVRDTHKMKRNVKTKDDDKLYKEYIDEVKDFIDKYTS